MPNAASAAPAELRCLITDDDPLSRQLLEGHVALTPGLTLAASLPDGLQLLEYLKTQPPVDLLFLDVEMPLLNGLDVLRLLPKPPAVVLTTSRPDFAVEAFALRVVDYLVKPIEYPRFLQALLRVREWLAGSGTAAAPAFDPAAAPAPSRAPESSLFVKTGGRLVRVLFSDILYVEAVGQYAVVVTQQQQLSTNQLLHELTARLPADQFTRVHRSFVVNRRQIEQVEDATIFLRGGRTVPVGRTYLKDFLDSLSPS